MCEIWSAVGCANKRGKSVLLITNLLLIKPVFMHLFLFTLLFVCNLVLSEKCLTGEEFFFSHKLKVLIGFFLVESYE